MDRGLRHCSGDRDQDHLQEKEMQKGKTSEEALQIAKNRREANEKRKDILIYFFLILFYF